MSILQRILDEMDVSLERDRDENGMWVYVTIDPDSREPINASGIYPSEVDAGLAMETEGRRYVEVFEEHLPRKVIPLFVEDRPLPDAAAP